MEDNRRLQRAALIVAALSSFVGPFMGSSVNVALPSIGDEFAMGAIRLGWVNTSYLLAAAAFLIPFGRLGDIYGRKRIYLRGVFVFTLASALVAISPTSTALIAFRVLQGIGSSMIFATGMPILISVFPPGQRGRALGLTVASVYLGLSVGPFFGGFVTQHLGWRFVFWTNLPLGLFLLFVVFSKLKGEWADAKGERFDATGSLILAASMLATMYGFTTLPSSYAIALLAAGIAGFALFVRFELRTAQPVMDLRLFRRNTVFVFSNLAALINYAATFAVTFLLSLFLQRTRGLSPQAAGLVLLAQPIIQTIFSPIAGRLSDRVEPRNVATLGMAITLVGLLMLLFVNAGTSLAFLIVCLIVLGFGFALFSSPNTHAIMGSVERRDVGIAGAMVGTMRQVGMMLSMGIVMMTLAIFLGDAEITPRNQEIFVRSMHVALAVFAGMCLGGVFASMARGKIHRE